MDLLCELLFLQRSSFYYTSKADDDSHLRLAIEEICLKQTRYGYRRVTNRLRRAGISVDKEKVRSLMHEMGLKVRPLRRKIQTTQSKKGKPLYPNLIKNLEIIRPNQVWCADITFIPLSKGKTVYLAILIDVFTRAIRGWELDTTMSEKLIDSALDRALAQGIAPEIHHSDHGGQYIAKGYCEKLVSLDCQISMAAKGKPSGDCPVCRHLRLYPSVPKAFHRSCAASRA